LQAIIIYFLYHMPIQKNIPGSTLGYTTKLLVISLLLHVASCNCSNQVDSKRNPSHNDPNTPPTTSIIPKLEISSLNYESTTGLITCILQNQNKNKKNASLLGKLNLQVTPKKEAQAIIQGVTLQDGKYTIPLDKKPLEDGANLIKTFTVEKPTPELASEFTFQIMYVDDKGVEEPVGSPATLTCSQLATSLKLKDLKLDVTTGQVTCFLLNQSKKPVTNVIIHWESKTNSAQIMQGGKAIQEIMIGNLKKEQEEVQQVIGNLDFGGQASATFIFWVTCMDDNIRHSEQTIEILNSLPVKLTLEPVGPTRLETDANKVFKVKIVHQAFSGSIDTSKVEFKITQPYYPGSSAKILYKNQAVTSLSAINLSGNMIDELALKVDPVTEDQVIFFVQLLYDKKEHGKVRFDWYKQEVKDAFEAIHKADFEAFQRTLDPTTINEHFPNKDVWGAGDTLLIRVIRSLDEDTGLKYVEELLKKGANSNISNNVDGLTPLHYAITKGQEIIMDRLLADDKLNLMIPSQWEYSPFHAAAEKADLNSMQKLLDKLQRQGKSKEQIADLLNTKDTRTGKTPLHLAADMAQYSHKSDTIQLLLKYGANPDMLDNQHNSPLYRIIHNRDIEAAKALLQVSSKKINQQNKEGNTPLHTAVWTGKVQMVQLLLDNGAKESINIKNNKGLLPAGYLSDQEGNFRFMSESDKRTMKELLTPTTP
jgi:ankyrin repeat protein